MAKFLPQCPSVAKKEKRKKVNKVRTMKTKFGCQKMSGLKRANNPGYAVFSGFFIVYLSFVVYK